MNALVTGASSGIGLQYSRELASRGYDVVMVSNQEVEIKQCAEDIAQCNICKTYGNKQFCDRNTCRTCAVENNFHILRFNAL